MTVAERQSSIREMMVLALSRKYFDFPKKDAQRMVETFSPTIERLHEEGREIHAICMEVIKLAAERGQP